MLRTATIQIGNSDDKLSQRRWAAFVTDVSNSLPSVVDAVHFAGGSPATAQWQNYCWVVAIEDHMLFALRDALHVLCARYLQDSIALTVGDTEFLDRSRPVP